MIVTDRKTKNLKTNITREIGTRFLKTQHQTFAGKFTPVCTNQKSVKIVGLSDQDIIFPYFKVNVCPDDDDFKKRDY